MRMELNHSKSGILEIKKRGNLNLTPGSLILGLPVVETYKYLGIIIDRRLNMTYHLKKVRGKVYSTIKRFQPYFKKNQSQRVRRRLFQLFCAPIIEYASIAFLTVGKGERLAAQYRKYGRICLGLGFNTPNFLVYSLLGRNPVTRWNLSDQDTTQ